MLTSGQNSIWTLDGSKNLGSHSFQFGMFLSNMVPALFSRRTQIPFRERTKSIIG